MILRLLPSPLFLSFSLTRSLACSLSTPSITFSPFLSASLSHDFSRSPLLLSSALDARRVAILALGLFVRPTTELASLPRVTPLCGQSFPLTLTLVSHRFAFSLSPGVCFN